MPVTKSQDPSNAVARLIQTIRESGVSGLTVVSGERPGDRTKSGNISYHSSGHAIDVAGSEQAMTAYARFLAGKYGSQTLELIHKDPDGTWWWINNGAPGRRTGNEGLLADHRDHVHFAATNMGLNSIASGVGGGVPGTPTTGVAPGTQNPAGAASEGVARVYGWLFGNVGGDGQLPGKVRVLYGGVGVALVLAGLTVVGKKYI